MKYFKISVLLLFQNFCFSQNQVVYSDSNGSLLVEGSFIQILEDKTNQLTSTHVLHSAQFKANNKSVPNLGISKSSFWLKFNIKNESENPVLLLNLAYPNLDEVELHQILPDTQIVEKLGKYNPYGLRNYNYPGYIFNLKIKQNTTATFLIKIISGGQIMAPIYIGNKQSIFETIISENLFVGVYSGIILIMFFYNLFIYFTVRDKIYLYYVGYTFIVGLVQLCLLGYTFQLFWPNSIWLAHHSVYLLSSLVGITAIEFIKVFLRTKEFTPKLHKGFYILTFIYLVYIVLDLFNLGDELYSIIQLCAMILSLFILIVSFRIMRMNYRPAKYLFYAWVIFLIGVFVYALKDVGILPYNQYTVFMMPIGSAIETALLSFALADRINILKKEKEESQYHNLRLLEENKRIIVEQNLLLESKVIDRTAQLEASNKSLKEAEVHLVNAEKMASLGQLTAGISHEINNPINFVVSNVKPLKRDIADILRILDKYGEIKDEKGLAKKLSEIAELKKQADLNYLIEEINLLLKGIDEGANRTSEIVKALKNFSRTDEATFKKSDIHVGIDSTLSILSNNIVSPNVKVVKNYGLLPPIECYPGKLNQVFMNILNNAIHAVLSKNYTNGEGTITITTRELEKEVEISIKDNGIGIPKSNFTKIFEPFFTTKQVGMGTGLGLSIVYGIINSHKGKIDLISEENVGTEFIITLPK